MKKKIDLEKICNAVSTTIEPLTQHTSHSGVVLIATKKETLYQNCFGYADIKKSVPTSTDTQFLIGSVTKQFTAVAILKALLDKNVKNKLTDLSKHIQLALNNTIVHYLPPEHAIWNGLMPPWANQVTLHQLLVHSSGIPNYTSLPDFENKTFSTPADLVQFFKNHELEFTPGEKFSYSNSGYYLLGFIIQSITHQDLDYYLENTFFKPLKMHSTFLPVKGTVHELLQTDSRFLHLARGYDYEMTKQNACLDETRRYASMDIPGAAGSLVSTVRDLLKWNDALYNEKIIPKFLLQWMLKPYLLTERFDAHYGYGIEIIKSNTLGEYYSHRGGIPGFCSILTFIPVLNVSIISLQNISANPEKLIPEIKTIQASLPSHLSKEDSAKKLTKIVESAYPAIIENRKHYELGPVYESVINILENTMVNNFPLTKAYSSQRNEWVLDNINVIGDVPTWLSGSFVSNGPAQFEVGSLSFNHWFDGFAMLKKFRIESGKIHFQNRFLRSQQYTISNASNQLYNNEFATYASPSLLGRLKHSIKELMKGNHYDNCNINTICIAEHFVAMTESADVIEFNLNDLSTRGHFQFKDNVKGQLSLAHPHKDITTGETINVTIAIGKYNKYHIYKIAPYSIKREVIQTYHSNTLFYMHSFSITSHYVILFKSPLRTNKMKLLLGLPFNNTLTWQTNTPSFFIIIDRRDGSIREIETEAFVCLHNVNAYEKGNELILDLICHGEGNLYNYLYLSNLTSQKPNLPHGTLRRYIINIHSKQCRFINLSSRNLEFPRIHYSAKNGKEYQFVYTNLLANSNEPYFDSIQKFNVQSEHAQSWKKTNYYLGEPVFVARPDAKNEDDGVVLSIAFNTDTQCSSLIILNALSMEQIAEASLPFHLPFGLHGNFYFD